MGCASFLIDLVRFIKIDPEDRKYANPPLTDKFIILQRRELLEQLSKQAQLSKVSFQTYIKRTTSNIEKQTKVLSEFAAATPLLNIGEIKTEAVICPPRCRKILLPCCAQSSDGVAVMLLQ